MSEVDDISQGLGTQLRGAFAAALAIAQIVAQRRAAQLREQAQRTGELEAEARRRFGTEQRVAALDIPLPTASMSEQELAESWAQAEVARAHAPEVAEFWDARARSVGVDPDQVRALWWQDQPPAARREDPALSTGAVAGLGAEGAAAVADVDRARAQDLSEAAERERDAAGVDDDDRLDAQAEAVDAAPGSPERATARARATDADRDAGARVDAADILDDRVEDLEAEAGRRDTARAGAEESVAASPGVWQNGHPPARLAGQAYGIPPGRGTTVGRRSSRVNGRGLAAAKQREHGLDR